MQTLTNLKANACCKILPNDKLIYFPLDPCNCKKTEHFQNMVFLIHGSNTKIPICAVDGAGTMLNGFRPSSMAVDRASTYFRVPAEMRK